MLAVFAPNTELPPNGLEEVVVVVPNVPLVPPNTPLAVVVAFPPNIDPPLFPNVDGCPNTEPVAGAEPAPNGLDFAPNGEAAPKVFEPLVVVVPNGEGVPNVEADVVAPNGLVVPNADALVVVVVVFPKGLADAPNTLPLLTVDDPNPAKTDALVVVGSVPPNTD